MGKHSEPEVTDRQILHAYGITQAASLRDALNALGGTVETGERYLIHRAVHSASDVMDRLCESWAHEYGTTVVETGEDHDLVVIEVRDWLAQHVDRLGSVLRQAATV